jgi:hyaluronate lyase
VLLDGPAVLSLAAAADAFVRDGSDADNNFGSSPALEVKQTTPGFNRESYLKFELTNVATSARAILRLSHGISTGDAEIGIYAVADTTWIESGIAWNNRPPMGTLVVSVPVSSAVDATVDFDVTSLVQAEVAAGHPFVTFGVHSLTFTNGGFITFRSREAPSDTPYMLLSQ